MQDWIKDKTLHIITENIMGFRLVEVDIQGLFDGKTLQFLIDFFPPGRIYSHCCFINQWISIFSGPVNIVFTFNTTEGTVSPHVGDNKVMRVSIISTPTHEAKGKLTAHQVIQIG